MFRKFLVRQSPQMMTVRAPVTLTDLNAVEVRVVITPMRFMPFEELRCDENLVPVGVRAYSNYFVTLRDLDMNALPHVTRQLVETVLDEFYRAGQ